MKILTTNFLTCAVKACKISPLSYPLHFRDATLERTEIDFNPLFIRNILPRVDWDALKTTASELGLISLVPESNPIDLVQDRDEAEAERVEDVNRDEMMVEADTDTQAAVTGTTNDEESGAVTEEVLKKLHELLLETAVMEGKLVCGNCGFEYPIKEGVGNFLLPAHLV